MPRSPRRWTCDALRRRRRASPCRGSSGCPPLWRPILVRRGFTDVDRGAALPRRRRPPRPAVAAGRGRGGELILRPRRARARGSRCSATTTWTACARRRMLVARAASGSARTRCGSCRAARRGLRPVRWRRSSGSPDAGAGLLVTVDCGITAVEEVARRARARHRRGRHRPPPARRRTLPGLPDRAPGARRG